MKWIKWQYVKVVADFKNSYRLYDVNTKHTFRKSKDYLDQTLVLNDTYYMARRLVEQHGKYSRYGVNYIPRDLGTEFMKRDEANKKWHEWAKEDWRQEINWSDRW